jgi:hypothetical protein
MKTIRRHCVSLPGILSIGLFIIATSLTGWSQTTPVLTITQLGTNQYSITFTNTDGTYDLQQTPMLANPDYPWTWAAIGTTGQTNFIVTGVYETSFYRAILDTNSVALWELADQNNPDLGILAVMIDSPTNNAVIQ